MHSIAQCDNTDGILLYEGRIDRSDQHHLMIQCINISVDYVISIYIYQGVQLQLHLHLHGARALVEVVFGATGSAISFTTIMPRAACSSCHARCTRRTGASHVAPMSVEFALGRL
jgi:hypothetical protein